jgi:hypothetical protein
MDARQVGFVGVLVIALALVEAGCGASSTSRGVAAASPTTVATTTQPPTTSPASKAPPPSTSAAAPTTAASATSASNPATVVEAYFAAIDAGNYEEAWALGGENLGESYSQFTAGFAATATDTVEILSTSGNTVTVDLTAVQTDGTQQQFTGTYTVTGQTITGASITQVGGPPPASTCGAPSNPYGYNFCGVGRHIYSPAPGVCQYFTCIDNFVNGRGYMVECNDHTYSMSGGIEDVCSDHGGEERPVYSGH